MPDVCEDTSLPNPSLHELLSVTHVAHLSVFLSQGGLLPGYLAHTAALKVQLLGRRWMVTLDVVLLFLLL